MLAGPEPVEPSRAMPATSDRIAAALAARIVPVSIALLIGYAAAIAAMIFFSHGGMDSAARPLGSDFSNVWAAGRLTLMGAPEASYDLARHYAEQQREFGPNVAFYGWHYPPMFLGVAALLATMPYFWALGVWQAATLPLYLLAVWKILGGLNRETWLLALAYPAVFVNLLHGHNGFLTAGLFGLGLYLLDRRPVAAGLLLGLLAYKPQFGVLLPAVLIATGRWRATAAATVSVLAAAGLSLAAFGPESWLAFRDSAAFTREVVLEQGDTGWHKIVTAFSAARALGADVMTAHVVQGLVALATLVATVLLWRSDAPHGAKAAALMAGSLLMTPYALDYDMMLLGPALAFLGCEALRDGFRRGEAGLLAFVWLAPIAARQIAEATLVPVGFLAILTLFVLAASRMRPLPAALGTPLHAAGR